MSGDVAPNALIISLSALREPQGSGFHLYEIRRCQLVRRDQRACCFTSRAAGRPCPPLDRARSATQNAPSSRAVFAKCRMSGGLPSAARRRALRSGFVPLNASLRSPLHFPRSPTTDRSVSCLSHRAQQNVASSAEAEPNIARTPKRC